MQFSKLSLSIAGICGLLLLGCGRPAEESAPVSSTDTQLTPAEVPTERTLAEVDSAEPPRSDPILTPGLEETDLEVPRPTTTVPDDAVLTPAQIIRYYPPFYPLRERLEGIEGQVVLELTIDEEGRVANPRVITATARQFTPYALAAAKDWRFLPAMIDGEPIAVTVTFPITFISERGSGFMPADSPLARLFLIEDTFYVINESDRFELANFTVTPLLRQTPFYPPALARDGIEGSARIAFYVNEQGRVEDPQVVEYSHPEFAASALEAVQYWQFIPRIQSGVPNRSRVALPFVFTPPKLEDIP